MYGPTNHASKFVLAVRLCVLGVVRAVVEATLEQLDGDDGEDELEQHVDDHDIENVLQRVDDTVKHRLATALIHYHGYNIISYFVQ